MSKGNYISCRSWGIVLSNCLPKQCQHYTVRVAYGAEAKKTYFITNEAMLNGGIRSLCVWSYT
jgi:hypothetical protein